MSTPIAALLLMSSVILNGDRPPKAPTARDGVPDNAHLDKVLDEVSFVREDLEEALTDLADDADLNLVVDWPALEAIAIYGDTQIDLDLKDVTVDAALMAILLVADRQHRGAAFSIRDGVLTITSKAVLDRQLEVRAYAMPSLKAERNSNAKPSTGPWRPEPRIGSLRWKKEMLARGLPPYVGIAETIQAAIEPESWERRGGPAGIRVLGDRLVVRQTRANHLWIERLINDLSASNHPAR